MRIEELKAGTFSLVSNKGDATLARDIECSRSLRVVADFWLNETMPD